MVSERDAVDNASAEPGGGLIEYREFMGARMPGATRELVDIVAGGSPEQRCQFDVIPRDDVDSKKFRRQCCVERVILVRQSNEKTRRSDTDLRCKADQTSGPLVALAGGDDKHRVVEFADQCVECACAVVVRVAGCSSSPVGAFADQ